MTIYIFTEAVLIICIIIIAFWFLDIWADKARSKRKKMRESKFKVAKSDPFSSGEAVRKVLESLIFLLAEYEKICEENVIRWEDLYLNTFINLYRKINVKHSDDDFLWIIDSWMDFNSNLKTELIEQGQPEIAERLERMNVKIIKQLKRMNVLNHFNNRR